MAKKITIIGGGPGGYVAAIRSAQLGAEVTLIEEDSVGGTCLNRGCIPSKVMKRSAEILNDFKRAQEFGISVKGIIRPDMKALMDRKELVISNQVKGIRKLLDHNKIRLMRGHAHLRGPNLAEVKLENDKTVEVPWDRLILAMGSRPLNIPSFPFDGNMVISSNEALNLQEIPESMMIVGGGVIGCEFGFIFSSLGSKVTLIEAMDRLLPIPSVDKDCSKVIQREMKKRKIDFMVNRTVERVEKDGRKTCVTTGPSPFGEKLNEKQLTPLVLETDKVLVSIGREPNTANIGMETLGINMDKKGWILADERMQTNIPGVYAVGDVLGPSKIMLAHVASREGLVAAENAMDGRIEMDYNVVPGAIFTMPEVACVGLTEIEAKERGYNIRADRVLFRNLGKAHVIGEIAGEAKIISEAGDGRVLGVHMVGPHVTDLIAEASLAMNTGCTVKQLAETLHPHPTLSEIMFEVSLKALDRSLHG